MTRFVAEKFPWICALWLHLALYAVLSDAALWRSVVPDPPEPVSVEIIPEFVPPSVPDAAVEDIEESQRQTVAVPPQTLPDPAPGSTSAPDQPPSSSALVPEQTVPPSTAAKPEQEWVTANTYFANDVLNDPRSAQAREFLPTLTSEDGREQICALEAMEQVRHARPGFKPTRLAPHAFRNSFQKEDTIVVPAGALRSNRVWYEIAYRCRLDASGKIVSGFEYALGAPIDRSLWDEYGLAPIH